MQHLSDAQKDNLMKAIDSVMEGQSSDNLLQKPNEKIASVVRDMNLSSDYVPIIVRAYNTGVQDVIREGGSSIQEKTASFPMASAEVIDRILYKNGSEVKQASYNSQYAPDDMFSRSANDLFGKPYAEHTASSCPFTKSANVKRFQRDNQKDFTLEAGVTDKVTAIKEYVRREKQASESKYDSALGDFADTLNRIDSPDIGSLKKLAYTLFDKDGELVINDAIARFGFTKRAYNERNNANFTVGSACYTTLKKAVDCKIRYNTACDALYKTAESCVEILKPMVTQRLSNLYNMDDPAYLIKYSQAALKNEQYELKKNAGLDALRNDAYMELRDRLSPDMYGLDPRLGNIMELMGASKQEAALRAIDLKTTMAKWLKLDPYLSKQDPEAVADSFDELMKISPELHNKPMLARSALVNFMETGGVDLAQMNNTIVAGQNTEKSRREDKANQGALLEKVVSHIQDQKEKDKDRVLTVLENSRKMEGALNTEYFKQDRLDTRSRAERDDNRIDKNKERQQTVFDNSVGQDTERWGRIYQKRYGNGQPPDL